MCFPRCVGEGVEYRCFVPSLSWPIFTAMERWLHEQNKMKKKKVKVKLEPPLYPMFSEFGVDCLRGEGEGTFTLKLQREEKVVEAYVEAAQVDRVLRRNKNRMTQWDDLKKTAESELRETDQLREESLTRFREWLSKNPDITNCRTDDDFLLRFLRTKKFSLPLAQEMLTRYLTIRQIYPKWYRGLDYETDSNLAELINSGYCLALPKRDEKGRQVIWTDLSKFDTSRYSSNDMVRVHSLVLETVMDSPQNQINGYAFVYDETALSPSHLSVWSLNDIRHIIKCIQGSLPVRQKEIHLYNLPNSANKILEFFTSLLNEKLKNRIFLPKSNEELQKHFDLKLLPKEFGGETSLESMIEDFKKVIKEKRNKVLSLDECNIDLSNSKMATEFEEMSGNFRKLQVD